MRLTELHPHFLKITTDRCGRIGWQYVEHLQDADGLIFSCPACHDQIGLHGMHIDHSIAIWKPGTSPGIVGTGRWYMEGTGYVDLVVHPSIHIPDGCKWHGFISDGNIVSANGTPFIPSRV